ncbi:MAG: cytochrome c biogenesis protein CcsA [Deltaproteobacteria bacterium]|nr:cytochrome c biogenesis protein CcsA [Deltaproteobacteria bacterium]
MTDVVFYLTIACYAGACGLYLAKLGGAAPRLTGAALPLTGAAVVAHIAWVGLRAMRGECPAMGIHSALGGFSVVIVLVFLAVMRRYRLHAVGAFVVPITLLMLLSARFTGDAHELPRGVHRVLLPIHIAANLLGLVAFALAFALAIGYLIQERQLKKKRLVGIFSRLPSLDVLDLVSFRCVTIGFPLLTVGMVLGAVVAQKLGEEAFVGTAQILAVLTWLLFAVVIALRALVGWRGRRAAIGTVLGFLLAAGVLVSYLLRSGAGPAAGA